MPNRILKESICASESVDGLSWAEECFFYRLIVNCDDYGRMDARPAILRARLFPLKNLADRQIANMLQAVCAAGMAECYEADGRPYVQLCTWERHQSVRAKRSKFPSPPMRERANATESVCGQMHADAPDIQSESESQSESEECAEGRGPSTPQEEPPLIGLPLNDGREYGVSAAQAEAWAALYPAVDVPQALRSMRGWLLANRERRKTARGIERFAAAWLSREQDKGSGGRPAGKQGGNPFLQMLEGET